MAETQEPRTRTVQATVKFVDGPLKGQSSTVNDAEVGMKFRASKPNGTNLHAYAVVTVDPVPGRFGAFAVARYIRPPKAPVAPKAAASPKATV